MAMSKQQQAGVNDAIEVLHAWADGEAVDCEKASRGARAIGQLCDAGRLDIDLLNAEAFLDMLGRGRGVVLDPGSAASAGRMVAALQLIRISR